MLRAKVGDTVTLLKAVSCALNGAAASDGNDNMPQNWPHSRAHVNSLSVTAKYQQTRDEVDRLYRTQMECPVAQISKEDAHMKDAVISFLSKRNSQLSPY